MFANTTGTETKEKFFFHRLEELNDEMLKNNLPAIIYTAVLMLVGTPGNFIVLYIYYTKWRRSTSRMFILYLALLDLVNCVTTLPIEIYIMLYPVVFDIPLVCKLSRFLTYTMNSSSALILIGIAVDRFKRICKPYKRVFSVTYSKHICMGAVLMSLTLTWPAIILYGTRRIQINSITGSSCLIENKYDSTPFPIIFFGFMGFMTLVIFTVLSVLYYYVGMQIYYHRSFKIKRCSQVERIVEEKSTDKSSNVKLATDSTPKCNKDSDLNEPLANGTGFGQEMTEDVNNCHKVQHHNGKDKVEVQLEPNCDKLNIPITSSKELSCGKTSGELCTKDMELEFRSHCEHKLSADREGNGAFNDNVQNDAGSKVHKLRQTRVRYILVRGSSTINTPVRTKCIECLTVRIGKSTFMLFLITVVYIVSFLPFYILALIRQSKEYFVEHLTPAGFMVYQIFLRSYLLSSAVNPVIYSFCNTQFRGYCKEICERIFTRKSELRSAFRGR